MSKVKFYDKDGNYKVVEIADVQPTALELRQAKIAEIEELKAQLSESDYKVVKLAECLAIGSEMPYNAQALHAERQALRDRINQLESEVDYES